MMKTKYWILIFALLFGGCLALCLWIYAGPTESTTVQVIQNGTCIREIDLGAVKEPYSFTVEDPNGGSNTVLVEPGRICIAEADCPDQVCVHRGWLSDNPAPIVCLPHRLVIQTGSASELDAVAQ